MHPDRSDLDAWIRAMELEGNVCADVEDGRLPTLGPGSCLGKGDHHGINRAMEMFDENDETCSAENERMIVLITSETPCTYWGARIGDWRNWYGGTVAQAYAAADAAALRGVSIAAVLVDNGNQGQCTTPWQQGLAPDVFVENMVRGVVDAALIQPTQSEFDDILEDLNAVLTVRLVE